MNDTNYIFFYGGAFSNWYPSPMIIDNLPFANSEQAFMWYKAITFDDLETADKVLSATDPRKAKALGRSVSNYSDSVWNKLRYNIMVDILKHKFAQNQDYMVELMATGNKVIVEASPTDTIWGIGLSQYDPDRFDEFKWKGSNLLGKALMDVRTHFNK